MLYVLYGNNREKLLAQLKKVIGEKNPERFDAENFDQGKISQLLAGPGLFGGVETIVIRDVFVNDDLQTFILKHSAEMQNSSHVFILIEPKILKKPLAHLIKTNAHVTEYKLPAKGKKQEGFNIFSITDAFGARDKKKLWILFQEARRNNLASEEIYSVLWWQIKNMLIVSKESKNPGIHPFVFQKTERALKNFKEKELLNIAQNFVRAFHKARRGRGATLDQEIEKLLLML
jgi:DNA polymerase III delta subunit